MRTNKKTITEKEITFEGARVPKVNDFIKLKRSVLATLLWENNAYESGQIIADRISELVPKVKPELVANLAVAARNQYKLRHVPLLLAVEMAKHDSHKSFVADVLNEVIQRADELPEALSIFWRKGKTPISSQFKKGLARAFTKFNAFNLSRYNQDKDIKLRDVLFLCHARPKDKGQAKVWKQLINNTLPIADTWETRLSASNGINKKEIWEDLLKENKMGALALLRNLRNFKENNVNEDLVIEALKNTNTEKVLPFRFIAAAKYAPHLEPVLEKLMFKCLDGEVKLQGKTALVLDVSGSMDMHQISSNSELNRMDAACGLALLARELCENIDIYTFSKLGVQVPARRGFALRDAIINSQPHKDTLINPVIDLINQKEYDRTIFLSDGQIADQMKPVNCKNNYMVNVSNHQNGIGYDKNWTNLNGWSETIIKYIGEIENITDEQF